jgi:hypothetical protein
MMEAGHAVVTDFGIASLTQALSRESLTDTGEVPGTPHYMAPEQLEEGGEADERTDIYGLGCVLYEMLAGEPPIAGASAQVVLARKLAGEIPRLAVARPAVPGSLETIVHRSLSRVPADRYQSMPDVAAALASVRSDETVFDEPRPGPERSFGQQAALWATGTVASLFGVGVIGFLATTAFDLKLQVPVDFSPTEPNHLLVGGRALLPVLVLAFVALIAGLLIRVIGQRVGATLTRVPVLSGPARAVDARLTTKVTRAMRGARPAALADGFLALMVVASIVALWPFGDLLSALWSTDTDILACEHKPHHRRFLVGMVVLVSGFGAGWSRLFPWLERRGSAGRRVALVRWSSFAWLICMLLVLTLPWRIINGDAERIRLDGAPAYLLDQTDAEFLVFSPSRGFSEVRERTDLETLERLGLRGHPFEGATAFDSGEPWCEFVDDNPEEGP